MKRSQVTPRLPPDPASSAELRALERAAAKLVRTFRRRRPLRGGSLIVTVFGDALAPHGASVWLSDLISLMEPFGLDARLTRTSVFRLTREGLLVSRRLGRRSYYTLTDDGRRTFDEATRRIYSPPSETWAGEWTWIILTKSATMRQRRELEWHGFAPVGRGIWAHPSPGKAVTGALTAGMLGTAAPVTLLAAPEIAGGADGLRRLVASAWRVSEIEAGYAAFLQHYQPIYDAARELPAIPQALAFEIRTLLIHEYRRLQLRDPHLPAALLPAPWLGKAAFELCRRLYELLLDPSEQHLRASVEGVAGPLPVADARLYQRFGGLARP